MPIIESALESTMKEQVAKMNEIEVFSFKRTRVKDFGVVNLLMEVGTLVKDFGELRLEQPPQELIDYMNQKYKETL